MDPNFLLEDGSILHLEEETELSRRDLIQLRALCQAADRDAFIPFSPALVSEQRIPAVILQLNSIVISSVERAIIEGCINT